MGSEVLAKRMVMIKKYGRVFCVLRGKVEELEVRYEGVDNKKDIHELLLKIEQNLQARNESGKKVISFAKDFAKYSDFDIKAFFEKISNDDKQTHESLVSLLQERKVLEHTASDMIGFAKRKRKKLELSVEDADAEAVVVEGMQDSEELRNENR
jgi:hypothetical protein